MKRLWLRVRWALRLTGQCESKDPNGGIARAYCQRREGHPGAHYAEWSTGFTEWRHSR